MNKYKIILIGYPEHLKKYEVPLQYRSIMDIFKIPSKKSQGKEVPCRLKEYSSELQSFIKNSLSSEEEHVAIGFSGHGYGVGNPGTNDKGFSLDDIEEIIKIAYSSYRKKFDIIFFDTCYNAMLDVFLPLSQYCQTFIASKLKSPNAGWTAMYSKWLEKTCDSLSPTAEDWAKNAVETYRESYQGKVDIKGEKYHLTAFLSSEILNIATKLKNILSSNLCSDILNRCHRIENSFFTAYDLESFIRESSNQELKELSDKSKIDSYPKDTSENTSKELSLVGMSFSSKFLKSSENKDGFIQIIIAILLLFTPFLYKSFLNLFKESIGTKEWWKKLAIIVVFLILAIAILAIFGMIFLQNFK